MKKTNHNDENTGIKEKSESVYSINKNNSSEKNTSSKRNLTLQSSIIFFRGKYTLYTTSIFSKAPGDFNNEESINKNNGSNVKNLTIHSKINDTIVYIENANENIQEKNERKQSKLKYEATIEEEDIQEKKEVKMNLQEKKEIS